MRGEQLDRAATEAFARQKYKGLKRLDGSPFYRHPGKVAQLAENMLWRHFRAKEAMILLPASRQMVEEAWHTGWLHDAIEDTSATYDEITQVTNLRVANWVAALSKDNRLPGPRRLREYTSQLAGQPEAVLIVKLADVGNNLEDMLALLKKQPLQSKQLVDDWPDELHRTLSAIERISSVALTTEFNWCVQATRLLEKCYRKPAQAIQILEPRDGFTPKMPNQLEDVPGYNLRGTVGEHCGPAE
jgi:hypothetical protein